MPSAQGRLLLVLTFFSLCTLGGCQATQSARSYLSAADMACTGCDDLTHDDAFRNCRALHLKRLLPKHLLASYGSAFSAYFESLPRDEFGSLKREGMTSNNENFARHEIDYERWEVLLPKDPFLQPWLVIQPQLELILKEALGADYVLHSLGSAVADPGAPAQRWHVDHPYLFGDDSWTQHGLAGHDVPPHAVTMLIPLKDLTSLDGFTQMCVGSSHLAGVSRLANVTDDGASDPDHWLDSPLFGDLVVNKRCPARCVRSLSPELGDVVLFESVVGSRYD